MGISLGFSRELSTLSFLMSGDRCSLGRAGEMYAKILFEAHGYLADIEHERQLGDLRIVTPAGSILRVEVKTARLSKRDYFEFGLKVKTKGGTYRTNCEKCDAVVLLGVNRSGRVEIYVLPAKAAANVSQIKIPSKLSAKSHWKQYRQYTGNINLSSVEELNREPVDCRNTDYLPIFTRSADWRTSQAGK